MGRKLPIKIVVETMTKDDLMDFLRHQDLPSSGTKQVLVDRLVAQHDRDLSDLMKRGYWTLGAWNEFADEEFDCKPRKSYEDLAEDLLSRASPEGDQKAELRTDFSGLTVADVRADDELLEALATYLKAPPRQVSGALQPHHGATLLSTIVDDLFEAVAKIRRRPPPASGDLGMVSSSRTSGSTAFATTELSDTTPPPNVPDGAVLAGRFRVLRRLGKGGFGAAYEAESLRPRRICVVKLSGPDKYKVNALKNEVEKLLLLDHPGLCRVYSCEHDPTYGAFLVVEHGGRSLAQAHSGGTSPGEMARIIAQAAEALDFLHRYDVVHGDVNPGNVLVDSSGRIRLTDFGLSGFLVTAPVSAGVTRVASEFRGAHPAFSAFEVLRGRPPSPRSDQFSLALVAQWLLCGEREYPDRVAQIVASLPARVRSAFPRASHLQPSERFRTCAEFALELADVGQ